MAQKTTQLITGILLVLITGVFWGTWFSLSRTMYHLPAEMFIAIGKEIIRNVAVPMSIIVPAALLGLVVLLIKAWKVKSVYFYCILATLVLFIAALLVTVIVEVPIDNQIKTWSAASVPAGWESIRDRWEHFHTVRTWVALVGITFFIVAILNRDRDKRMIIKGQ
jgi:uncharacterized membrane protein